MNNSELDKLLKSVPVPERPHKFWADLPKSIGAKLHWGANKGAGNPSPRARWLPFAWGISFVAACCLMGLLFTKKPVTEHASIDIQNEKLVNEVLGLFPNQVQAILENENGLQLVLSEKPNIPRSTPIWIKVCDGSSCRSIVTFSGQMVEVNGQKVEVLADSRQQVMLVGEHFFWSSAQGPSKDNLEINAQAMNYHL